MRKERQDEIDRNEGMGERLSKGQMKREKGEREWVIEGKRKKKWGRHPESWEAEELHTCLWIQIHIFINIPT